MASQPGETPHPEDPGVDEPQPNPELNPQPGSGPDLLTIGLLVFFVSLLVIVAALLVMPRILG